MIALMLSYLWRLIRKPFGKTLLGFVCFQLAFLAIVRFEWFQQAESVKKWFLPLGIEYAQTAFFVVCVHLLVALNTVIFINHSGELYKYASCLNSVSQELARKKYDQFHTGLIISVVIAVVLATLIVLCNLLGWSQNAWALILKINEGFSILIYLFFLLADFRCYEVSKIMLKEDSLSQCTADQVIQLKKVADSFQKSLKSYLLACDVPGLFGISLITILSWTLHPMLAGFYWMGFVAGAIGLHMAFSQSVLAFLSTIEVDIAHN